MISIAFPAIGTGTLRYPPNIAASKMFQAVEEVAATSNLKYLREVNFVIFPTDEHVLQVFINTCKMEIGFSVFKCLSRCVALVLKGLTNLCVSNNQGPVP